jgi:transcriptional regulator with XRE-family HTH domain
MKGEEGPGGEDVNKRIKAVRLALRLSQRQFCKQIHISSSHYCGIEAGERNALPRLVDLVCARFRVRERFLTTGEEPMFETGSDPIIEEILRIARSLPPELQEYLLKQAQNLADLAGKSKG